MNPPKTKGIVTFYSQDNNYHQDEKNEVLNMAFDKLVEWPVGCVRTMEAKGAHAFFELCGELVKSEPRPRHEI